MEKAILVGIDYGHDSGWTLADSMQELAELAYTAGAEVCGQITQNRKRPDGATFIGKGKLDEIEVLLNEHGAGLVIVDDEISPSQQRNLETALKARVIDRTGLILDIFAARAQTSEAKLQIELAQIEYLLPRLTQMWEHFGQQKGGIGLKGPGETQLEVDRRKARKRMSVLKDKIEHVKTTRAIHRRKRQGIPIPVGAIVGYTNAGKSTLLNKLTDAGVLAEDKLFATLDPITRRYVLPNKQEVLLTDTVGFIKKLPTHLVNAFRATLEEIGEADFILHILDTAHPHHHEMRRSVEATLLELGVKDKPILLVQNKIDLGEVVDATVDTDENPIVYQDVIRVSAQTGVGLDQLEDSIIRLLGKMRVRVEFLFPYQQMDLVHKLKREGLVLQEEYLENHVRMELELLQVTADRYREYNFNA